MYPCLVWRSVRYIILGTGLVGHALEALIAQRGVPMKSFAHREFDEGGGISKTVMPHIAPGDIVVNAAALTAVDACEDRVEEAMEVNGEEPGRLAHLCLERGARLVHISTDTVLDITNVYAKSKALGEQRVREAAGDDALILRISTVFGPHPRKVDFVRFVIGTLRKGEDVRAITDMICSPTYTLDAARAIVAAAEGGARGTHAFVNEPSISRHEFALRIQSKWGAPGTVRGVPMSDFTFKARRPKDTTMHATVGAWHEPMSLEACLADYRTRWA